MNIAIITAAGSGSRMKQEIPKQFINVNDKPIIIYTLEAFESNPNIDKIIVICLDGWEEILKAYAKQYNISKLFEIVKGGKTGQESILHGLSEAKKHFSDDDIITIHDGNRPLVNNSVLNDNLSVCKKYGNAIASIPSTEVPLISYDHIKSNQLLNRDVIMRTQTPHSFRLGEIYELYMQALADKKENIAAGCALMVEYGREVFFSVGSPVNFKLTTPDDMKLFKALLLLNKKEN